MERLMPSIDAIDLSDSQMDAVARAVAAILPADRDPFLRSLTHKLRGETIGDGSVGRAIRDLIATGNYRTMMTVAIGAKGGVVEGRHSKLVTKKPIWASR
jgi:hypothetical protein